MGHASTLFTVVTVAGFVAGYLTEPRVSAADLQVGELAPEFSCLDDEGKVWNSRDHVGKRYIVLYFYRGDFSRCCTRQAEGFRNLHQDLENKCADAIGVSGDIVETHQLFKKTYKLNQSLLADSDGNVAKSFGVPLHIGNGGKAMIKDANEEQVFDEKGAALSIARPVTVERWTFIIGLDGRVIYRDTAVAPKSDAQEVLKFLP